MKLPLVGLGTWQLKGEECTKVVQMALGVGYRHIDTAHVYENHQAIKKGIQGFDRSQLYITSKIAVDEQIDLKHVEESVKKACEQTLKELGIDYLDLYLIHWPDRKLPLELIFQTMEKLKNVKKVGVSNFTVHHLEDFLRAGFTPFANQVEFHPYLLQNELLDYCRKHNIYLISYRSLGKGKLLHETLFKELGEKYEKTPAQIILRWVVQKEIPVIPKASSEKHLKENLAIFDFTLTAAEMKQIDGLHQNKRYCDWEGSEFNY